MFQQLLCRNTGVCRSEEMGAFQQLLDAHKKFAMNDEAADWHLLCGEFLSAVDMAAQACRLMPACRAYRKTFCINYQALFSSKGRHYRPDVFKASFDECPTMYVNGEKYEFDAKVRQASEQLQRAYQQLEFMLVHSHGDAASKQIRGRSSSVLTDFDAAWANFERRYIHELMAVEEKARSMLVQAIDCDKKLRLLEEKHQAGALHSNKQYQDVLVALMRWLGSLNAVANTDGKGRDDFSADIILRCLSEQASPSFQSDALAQETAQHLCAEVLDSFANLRQYLQEVSQCLECVDPHLCKNDGLVSRLADFEQSYELGMLYVKDADTMRSLCLWVSQLQHAQSLSSDFAAICESFDAELFLVLPRIIWLSFLAEPSVHTAAMRAFLPEKLVTGVELTAFRSSYLALGSTRDDLLRLAVRGPCSADGACGAFLLQLERWSIELQRGHPREWNQCSEVMVRCLAGSLRKHRGREFVV